MTFEVRKVATGLGFIEGPLALSDGGILVTDMISAAILRVDLSTGRAEIHATLGGSPNGMAAGPDGALYVCNSGGWRFTRSSHGLHTPLMDGQKPDHAIAPCIQRVDPDGSVTVLYDACGNNPLVAPNDIVFAADGSFYFTDMGRQHGRLCDLGAVYRARPDGSEIVEIIREASLVLPPTEPNGIGLSPNGRSLYVAETLTGRLWTWPITADGTVDRSASPDAPDGPRMLHGCGGSARFDSLAVDSGGFICVATLLQGGISVIAPDGGLADFVRIPDEPYVTNICFGIVDPSKAYVTGSGRGEVWEIDWPRPGLALAFNL